MSEFSVVTYCAMRDFCLWVGIDPGWMLLAPIFPLILLCLLLYAYDVWGLSMALASHRRTNGR